MMNKNTVAACGLVAILAILIVGLVAGGIRPASTSVSQDTQSIILPTEDLSVQASLSPSEERQYILREFDGQIAVFVPDDSFNPIILTGILTSSLPKADREQLQLGIVVAGDEELAKLLEDFGS